MRNASTGHTVADCAKLLRVGEDKIRRWIRTGDLAAVNTSCDKCRRPRFVVLPAALDRFIAGRSAATPSPPKTARRKQKTKLVDFYPD